MKTVSASFSFGAVRLPLPAIHPIRLVKGSDAAFGKYRAIVASIREVGLVEPLVVYPQKNVADEYILLDGHLRLKALQELDQPDALCLISTSDEPYTYNEKVNRISVIQEHTMIMRAIEQGVTPGQIAKALDVDIARINDRMKLLEGIDPAAVELLKARPITSPALKLFRKVKPLRQVDMAQLMISANTFTSGYAEALVVGTPLELLVEPTKPKKKQGMSAEELARMETEMETLERDYRLHEEQLGQNSLQLNAAQRYVKRLLENEKVKRFLGTRYPELLEEFDELVAIDAL